MCIVRKINSVIDWLYIKPFRKTMSKQVFRYLMCGMINFIVTIGCYALAFHFIFGKRDFNLGFVTISPHVAALGISMPISFLLGFWLQRNISFKQSPLKGHIQLTRHLTIAIIALAVTYALTKLFVDVCGIFPTVAQIIIYCITAVLTYVAQKYFTFRGAMCE